MNEHSYTELDEILDTEVRPINHYVREMIACQKYIKGDTDAASKILKLLTYF